MSTSTASLMPTRDKNIFRHLVTALHRQQRRSCIIVLARWAAIVNALAALARAVPSRPYTSAFLAAVADGEVATLPTPTTVRATVALWQAACRDIADAASIRRTKPYIDAVGVFLTHITILHYNLPPSRDDDDATKTRASPDVLWAFVARASRALDE